MFRSSFFLFSVAAFAVTSQTGFADWNASSLEWAKQFQEAPVLFPNPYLIEAWSAAKDQDIRDAHMYIESVPNAHMAGGKFKIAMQTKRDSWGHAIPAPLMLYLPGIFTPEEDRSVMRAAADYSARGYHVVVPPNPWSLEFIQLLPDFNPGTLDKEAEIALAALEYAVAKIGPEAITEIDISGESYGALIAAITFEMDHAKAHPLINGSATLFSPPYDMETAINNLDDGIDRSQKTYENDCSSAVDLAEDAADLTAHKTQAEMSPAVVDCSESLVFHVFQSSLTASIELLHKLKGIGSIPTDKAGLAAWREQMRFAEVVEDFTPENKKLLEGGKGSLLYWLSLLPPSAAHKVQILTTRDDLLNVGVQWPSVSRLITSGDLIMLPWGGHTGYDDLPSFQGLLDAAFGAVK